MRPSFLRLAAAALAAVAFLSPAARAEFEMITPGPATLEGVLVRWEGQLLLMTDAGTKKEKPFVAKGADPEIAETLAQLAVEREPIALEGKTEMQQSEGGLWVPVPVEPDPVYPESAFRKYEGTITFEGEFHISGVVAKPDQEAHIEARMPMARRLCRQVMEEVDNDQLEMAFTVMEKMGLVDQMLRKVAPLFAEPPAE